MSDRAIPTSSAQHGIWVTERAGVAGQAYLMPLVMWFEGALDAAAFAAACGDVVARHELLRSVLIEEGAALAFAAAKAQPELRHVDLSNADGNPRQAVDRFVREEMARSFDLGAAVCRFTLLHLGARREALVFLGHHLVFDGISKDVLVRDLSEAYNARVTGRAASTPRLETLVAFALDRQEQRLEQVREDATIYWKARWREATTPNLPGLSCMPSPGDPGGEVRVDIAAEVSAALATAARDAGVSRFDVVAATLRALLHRYGNADIGVAIEMSTRDDGSADHVGMFVNELALLVAVTADTTARQLARAIHDEVRELNPLRAVPLARAGIAIGPGTSVLPVSLSYRKRSAEIAFAGVDASVDWMIFNGTARNALHLQVVDDGEVLTLSLQFAAGALPRADAERIARHFTALLRAATVAMDTPLIDLDLLDADERSLLESLNDTSADVDLDETVVSLFRRRALATPSAVAISGGGRSLTYAELDDVSDRAARRLRASGAGADTLVGLRMSRSVDMLVAMLAVMKAGAAYLPIDPSFPAERIAFILDDAAAPLVIADDAVTGDVNDAGSSHAAVTLAIDDLTAAGEADTGQTPTGDSDAGSAARRLPAASDLAYVIYTSGSTGRPKGVEVEHRPLTNLLHAFNNLVGDGRDTWLAHTSLSFDISMLEFFAPLVVGGRVVLATDEQVRDGGALVRLVRDQAVSHVQATPSGWRMLLAAGFGEPSVVALAGGEALPEPLATEIRNASGRLFNCYGPTEATVWCTVADLSDAAARVTIGTPLANTSAYVLDERLRPLPVGISGELYVGGVALARGYRGRPELTTASFVPNPFAPGERLYRTGDLARVRSDGALDCLGRTDNQVKLRGHRIELGEIEAALARHTDIEQAVVVLDDVGADARLVAYIVPKSAGPGVHPAAELPALPQLREHLAAFVPEYMVPRWYVALDTVPLTPNGKVDRAKLPEPPASVAVACEAPEPKGPENPLVAAVQAIFRDVLGVPSIGVDDDLFDLGGHSLTITQIMARIRDTLDIDVPLYVFFDMPTVAGVVAAIAADQGS